VIAGVGGGDGAVVALAGTVVVWNAGTGTLVPDRRIAGVGDGDGAVAILAETSRDTGTVNFVPVGRSATRG
jgi:hypothetical protein